ncbi:MAG: type II toxin-antitoxin system ParD family antitoxin [Proteobacteria bacterium]|nr:type II toxin-antitoxin system ParD family antitoxin [Pseudomonadota bacterium]MBU1687157.1 type II toxin-antitoxin system ParD family antitoxin [Pseudomonadota bacterium]
MNVSLTPEMDVLIAEKIKSGMYKSSSELIREGLRLLQLRDEQRLRMAEDLRSEVLIGVKQLDAGTPQKLDQKLIDTIKRDARKMFAV